MIRLFATLLAGFVAFAASAQDASVMTATEAATDAPAGAEADVPTLKVLEAGELTLEEFKWIARLVVVFADTPADPRFQEQMELLGARPDALLARDVVVIVDTDPAARSAIRLNLRPRGFQLTLVAKDGQVNLRKAFPWDVREITRAIDKWPLRQEEIRAQNAG